MDFIVEMHSVTKLFGEKAALGDFNLNIRRGEATALLGPSGSGKTTALKIMQGLLVPTSGSVSVCGGSPRSSRVRAKIGTIFQSMDFPARATPRDLFAFGGAHYKAAVVDDNIVRLGLTKLLDRRMELLMPSERMFVAIALAFVGSPELLLLDDPVSFMEASALPVVHSLLNAYLRNGGTAVLTSAHLIDVEDLCSRIVILENGRNRIEGTAAQINTAVGQPALRFTCADLSSKTRLHLAGPMRASPRVA